MCHLAGRELFLRCSTNREPVFQSLLKWQETFNKVRNTQSARQSEKVDSEEAGQFSSWPVEPNLSSGLLACLIIAPSHMRIRGVVHTM